MKKIIAITLITMLLLSCNAFAADAGITALNKNKEEISAIETGTITFQSEVSQNAALIAVVYDKNDNIIDFSVAEKIDNKQQTTRLSVQINVQDASNKIIAMLWDSFDAMNPLCDELKLK